MNQYQWRNWVKPWAYAFSIIFWHIHWRWLRKNQYSYYYSLLTVSIYPSMKFEVLCSLFSEIVVYFLPLFIRFYEDYNKLLTKVMTFLSQTKLEHLSMCSFWEIYSQRLNRYASMFYFAINTNHRKLFKNWKNTNLLNLNTIISKNEKSKQKTR